MSTLFDSLNRICADVFSDGEVIAYAHVSGFVEHLGGVFVDHVAEPTAPGPITQMSIVTSDLQVAPAKQDMVTRGNGDRYIVTELTADNGGMTHFQLRKHS